MFRTTHQSRVSTIFELAYCEEHSSLVAMISDARAAFFVLVQSCVDSIPCRPPERLVVFATVVFLAVHQQYRHLDRIAQAKA